MGHWRCPAEDPLVDSDELPVYFEPTLVGKTSSQTFTLTNDDLADLTLAPILMDGANSDEFAVGTVAIGRTGPDRTFTIKNIGTAALTGLAVSTHGKHQKDFIITRPTKKSLAPGASLTFKVKFKPSGLNTRSASLRIRSNDGDENPFRIDLSGFGARLTRR